MRNWNQTTECLKGLRQGRLKLRDSMLATEKRRLAWLYETPFEDLGLRTWSIWRTLKAIRALKQAKDGVDWS